jgi:hypothetical protein
MTNPRNRDLYQELFEEDERRLLAAAEQLEGVDAELAVMRVLVRKALASGDVDQARRCVESLTRVLKLRRELEAAATERADDALGRVLDTLSQELGVKL